MSNKEERFGLSEALNREYEAIWGGTADFKSPDEYLGRVLLEKEQAALCLSGGGVRSAAFCLGVVQALAAKGLLSRFHYLSTVSGGGYIGAWLQSLLQVERGRETFLPDEKRDAVERVERILCEQVSPRQSEPKEPDTNAGALDPLDQLRGFTSFLTPQPGLMSADTWAAIALCLRNLIVNWAVFLPAMIAAALMPLLYRDLLGLEPPVWIGWLCFAAALAAQFVATFHVCTDLPSHACGSGGPKWPQLRKRIIWWDLAWAGLLPLALAYGALGWMSAFLGTLAVSLAGYGAAFAWAAGHDERRPWLFKRNWPAFVAASAFAAALVALGAWLGRQSGALPDARVLATLGPLWAVVAHLLHTSVYVALRVDIRRGDLDREWLARLSGQELMPTLLWTGFAGLCVWAMPFVAYGGAHAWAKGVVGAATPAAGLLSALLGKNASSGLGIGKGAPSSKASDLGLAIGAVLFAAGLAILLSWLGQALVRGLVGWTALDQRLAPSSSLPNVVFDVLLGLVGVGLSWAVFGRWINVNRFSLHALYRNRLTRAFPGSARPAGARHPDPFTDFDPEDGPPLSALKGERLFPVINAAMNLVDGERRDWAERKAAPFTFTPLACGSRSLPEEKQFIATCSYAGMDAADTGQSDKLGMSLGTAMTISGAAFSPNMGYHSSPALAFLMTLFNVRLGAWLPNPAFATLEECRRPRPPNTFFTLVREALGHTNDTGEAVYLSDGGHFENLGLYEMVRRGCRLIVVVDAGQDGAFGFEDLGNALRKIRIDLRVEVSFPDGGPTMVPAERWDKVRCQAFAVGRICWPEMADAMGKPVRPEGTLLYLKPCLPPGVPEDVRAYEATNHAFPHDPTINQFFTESQFESYRRLGQHLMWGTAEAAKSHAALRLFFSKLDSPRAEPLQHAA